METYSYERIFYSVVSVHEHGTLSFGQGAASECEQGAKIEDYHSHNTHRLDVEGMKELLLKLRFIREDLGLQPRSKAKEIRSE